LDEGAAFPTNPSQAAGAVIGEREISVSESDTFWSISEQEYGSARYFTALARYNSDRVAKADQLNAGTKLKIPPPELLEAKFPDLFGNRVEGMVISPLSNRKSAKSPAASGHFIGDDGRPRHRVGERDTLSSIAQQYLGRAARWTEVYELNRDQLKDPSTLRIGMVLKLPSGSEAVPLSPAGEFDR
jgi:nucleoid-associated protein YgaU